MMFLRVLMFLMLAFLVYEQVKAEGGMIPFDSPVGGIGGRGHWYALRTMKGEDYWPSPAILSDIRKDTDGTYHVSGEPPVSISLVLHPHWYPDNQPWRRAIDWVRQAEQMFRNSGVPVRFVIESIQVWEKMPSLIYDAYKEACFDCYENGADLVALLMPHMGGDPYCGAASIQGRLSVSSCDPVTLAHELGHNFGLKHDFNPADQGNKGYCRKGESRDSSTCEEGTIMAYAQQRVPFFSSAAFEYEGSPLGNEESNVVPYLNKYKTGKALAWELANRDVVPLAYDAEESEEHFCR